MMSEILAICGAVTVVAAAIAVIFKGVKFVLKLARRVSEFLDDWNGEPAREGVEERPGVMKRLAALEELQPNHGGSVKDAVKRIDENLVHLRRDFDAHVESLDN